MKEPTGRVAQRGGLWRGAVPPPPGCHRAGAVPAPVQSCACVWHHV